MEIVDRRTRKGRKSPRVPIKTYKWEEVRRSRRRGGYPWTHLYKEPFFEDLDPEPWTMDGMRKAKSSSTMGKSDFSISEVSTFDNRSSIDEVLDNPSLDIRDKTHSIKTSCSSLNLEEQEMDEDIERTYEIIPKGDKENLSPGMFFLHSEESLDNISQYLDKEERVPTDPPKKTEDLLQPDSEETDKKRKLSADSSGSKISLGKKAILQKLKDTKDKIKVSKISFPTKIKKPVPKKKNSPPTTKKNIQKSSTQEEIKPVYIHIPLKPPPGEIDEYSHLEHESVDKTPTTMKPESFRDLVQNMKHLKEPIMEHKHPSPIREVTEEDEKPSEIIIDKEIFNNSVKNLTENDPLVEDILILEVVEADSEPEGAVGMIKLGDEPETPDDEKTTNNHPQNNDFFDKLFEASTSRERTNSQKQSRKARSKSAEPERKRKLSLESSYSRKSLSRLGLLKKLKNATDKIKTTLSRATSKKDIKEKVPEEKIEKPKQELKPHKNVEPVYIHIPLKPPEGKTDEFSHLESESPAAPPPAPAEVETPDVVTPPANGDVQLIILTAPSDDEILDYNSSDVPETPVTENKVFFPVKVQELKKIAKEAVDEVTNGSTSNVLASVAEESVKIEEETEDDGKKVEQMMVDEEDGLSEAKKQEVDVEVKEAVSKVVDDINKDSNESDRIDSETKEVTVETIEGQSGDAEKEEDKPELKSVLKSPNSPVMKKKVSFKRKSKSKSIEDQEEGSGNVEEPMEVDADKVKEVDKEDDKWSKISDHEDNAHSHLEPPHNMEIPSITLSSPSVIISTEQALGTPEENYNLSTKHVYEEISEDSKKKVAFSANDSRSSESSEKPKQTPNRFQAAFKQKADNFKTRLQNIKRPSLTLPDRPKFQKPNLQRFKIEKPKWNMPKIPDTAKINLPHFSLPRKGAKKPVKRISSTESTSGGSRKIKFDFGTYPRIFKKKPKPETPDFATIPRTINSSKSTEDSRKSATDSVRIPLHAEDSLDKEENFNVPTDSSDLGQSSHIRYDEGIDSEDDEYDKETKEMTEERDFLSRWQRGRFNDEYMDDEPQKQPKVTDLDSPSDDKEFSSNNGKDQRYSSGSSVHRQGVLEEINPDEFFLRQKGISQDNIEVGMYLSTEIREAFRNPTNALVQMEDHFDKGSHQSLPDMQSKRKPIKKPKRKKTPHASQEQIPYAEESGDEEVDVSPPSRPKRRSKRRRKTNEEFVPYQETIPVNEDRLSQHRESLGILADDEQDFMYENEMMEGIDQPQIKVTDPYKNYGEEEYDDEVVPDEYIPEAPPRSKPKNIKSLKTFEAGTAIQNFSSVSTVPNNEKVPERISYHTKEKELIKESSPELLGLSLNIREPENSLEIEKEFNNNTINLNFEESPPPAPPRKHKSLKSLTVSENDSMQGDLFTNKANFSSEKNLLEPQIDAIRTESKIIIPIDAEVKPMRPSRSRSRGNSKSRTGSRAASESGVNSLQDELSLHADSLADEGPVPCVEEPCVKVVCDYMGYTTVDRNKPRDPPLPPPRTLQRKKKKKAQENNFFTIPRTRAQEEANLPVRPNRIYSTIASKQKSATPEADNKENIEVDILQYIEQDNRDLQSGEVIEKIKTRPLPTPPRPPRKTRPLSDITSRENIMVDSTEDLKKSMGETEVYTQTEPLPDDFVCEEVVQEPTDKVIIPTQAQEKPRVKRELITPTVFTHEETITHGSLLVEPLNGAKILPDSDFTQTPKETILKVHVESDADETSSIPEDFHKLSNPKEEQPSSTTEKDVLKTYKLQVTDLDVDTLTVNKLLADKLVVSEIDSGSLQTNEISSKTGALKVGEITLPPEVVEQIIRSLQSAQISGEPEKKDEVPEQKKTPIEPNPTVVVNEEENLEDLLKRYSADPETSEEERISNVSATETVPIEDIPPSLTEVSLATEMFPYEATPEQNIPEEVPNLVEENVETQKETVESLNKLECNIPDVEDGHPLNEEPPHRPPRQSERLKASQSITEVSMQELEVDDEPPPRPPNPPVGYMPSQPPASFYSLRAQKYVDETIPAVPRRRRHVKSKQLARSSSEESSEVAPVARRHHRRNSEPSVLELSGQLVRACGSEANNALKRLITYILKNVFNNEDGKQDLNVMIIIILVLIAGLLLLGYGEERTVVHLHHWEYFNPPKDL